MRPLTIGIFVLLLAATGLPAQKEKDKDKDTWQKFTPKDTKIEVRFPGTPKEIKSPSGPQYLVEASGGKAGYMLAYTDLPQKIDVTDKDEVKRRLDGGRDGSVKALKGKLLADKDVKVGKYPGRAYDIEMPLGVYKARIYLTPNRLVQVIAIGPKDFTDGEDAKKFLDSLKIGD
jgi:hypothetical protein